MTDKLTLEVDPNTVHSEDDESVKRFHFYESSVRNRETGLPLFTMTSRLSGMRLTVDQAVELHKWLGEWILGVSK